MFLRQEKLITAEEDCKLSPHAQCIGYDKPRCLLDGISENRCVPHVPVCVCKGKFRGVWGADEDVRKRDRRCERCDCYENGTKYCLKRSYDYCKCRRGYEGNKCNHLNHFVMFNGQLTNKDTEKTAFDDDPANIGFYSNRNNGQEERKSSKGQSLYVSPLRQSLESPIKNTTGQSSYQSNSSYKPHKSKFRDKFLGRDE